MKPLRRHLVYAVVLHIAIFCLLTSYAMASTVGASASCDFHKIQDAINAHPGFASIIVTPGEYDEVLDLNNIVLLLIGVANDDSRASGCVGGTNGFVLLNGAGHARAVINVNGSSSVFLDGLTIENGGGDSSQHGGGIYFSGIGTLSLENVELTNNHSGYGGGLSASAVGGHLDVVLLDGVYITMNHALTDGGGIHIDGDTLLSATQSSVFIDNNKADHNGGGIDITGPARADLGSTEVAFNSAFNDGGGISVLAHDADNENAVLRLFTTDPSNPVKVDNNSAFNAGGGVYLQPFNSLGITGASSSSAALCAYEFQIDANSATNGTAIYIDQNLNSLGIEDSNAGLFANATGSTLGTNPIDCEVHPAAVLCSPQSPCDEINGNRAFASAPDAAVIFQKGVGGIEANRLRIQGNKGGRIYQTLADGGDSSVARNIRDSLIADNTMTGPLFVFGSNGAPNFASVIDTTVAHNVIGGASVAVVDGGSSLSFVGDIVDEGVPTVTGAGASAVTADYVLSTDVTTLRGPNVITGDPKFVAVELGNYHLQPTSPAIDRAPAPTDQFIPSVDLDNRSRGIPVLHTLTPFDLGAYESQTSDRLFCSEFEISSCPAVSVPN